MRLETGRGERLSNQFGQVPEEELLRRKLDRDGAQCPPGVEPGFHLPAGAGEQPGGQWRNQPAVFGNGDEACRIPPAQQRFRADHLAAAGGDQRLVIQAQIAIFDRCAQVRRLRHALDRQRRQGFAVAARCQRGGRFLATAEGGDVVDDRCNWPLAGR